jgi:selenocysteine-specific elongation factor
MPLLQLKTALGRMLVLPECFEVLVSDLSRNGFAQAGAVLKRAAHQPALPQALQGVGVRVRTALRAQPLDPPSRNELAPDKPSQDALRFLLQTGEAVEIAPEIIVLNDSLADARKVVIGLLEQRGSATVSELKQALGVSRRIAVPLLEWLDRSGITRREGDRRVLR